MKRKEKFRPTVPSGFYSLTRFNVTKMVKNNIRKVVVLLINRFKIGNKKRKKKCVLCVVFVRRKRRK